MSVPDQRVSTPFPRELLVNLTLRELRGQYKRSFLGWAWSAINPLVTLVIYAIVFSLFLRIQPDVGDPSGLDSFAFFMMAGLLPWQFHANGMTAATGSLVVNENLITKIYFPRAVLPASALLAGYVTFLIELVVFLVALLIVGNMVLPWLPLLIVITMLQFCVTFGIGLALSVANVYFRDVQHLISIAVQAWFWLTPIVYPLSLVPTEKELFGVSYQTLVQLNPMVTFVVSYRNVMYDLRWPAPERWAVMVGTAVFCLALGAWIFRRLEPRLAEEI